VIAGALADEGVDIGADVPAAEGVEVPICLYSGDFGV
jgi:hypothetical protein